MCKTTKGTQTANQDRYRGIQRDGSGPGGAGPDPEVDAPAALVGDPDYAPQSTFIARATPADNGFIDLARRFHENSGLGPKTITSIEKILELLNDPSETGTEVINRIRIVSHIFVDSQNLIEPTNMLIPFLEGGANFSLKRHFEGFAGTRIDALKSMMTFEVPGDTTYYIHQDEIVAILNFLRSSQAEIIEQIPTDPLGEPTGDFPELIKLAASKWVLREGAIPNAAATAAANDGYDVLLADVIARLEGNPLTEAQLHTLRDSIISLGPGLTARVVSPARPADYAANINATLRAIQDDAFRTNLNQARQRLNGNSKVDIRGCQVGRDEDFLRAVQKFFGTSESVRPTVSGPRWFQHFNQIGHITGLTNNARVQGFYNSGFSPYSATQTRQHFETWATGFGITDAHLDFWQDTLGLDVLQFCRLQWQANIPEARISIDRLDDIRSVGFTRDAFLALANMLLLTSPIPNARQIGEMEPLRSNLATWTEQLEATVSDSTTATQLSERFTQLRTIYVAVDRRFRGRRAPSAGQQVIPAMAPPGLTAQMIRNYQTQLKGFINSNRNSKFQPAQRFLTAALPRVQDDPAKMRYFLGLGLPFLLYDPNASNSNVNILIAFIDRSGPADRRRQNDAVKYWIRAQWQGFIPNGVGAGTTFTNSRHTPWLVENRQPAIGLTTPPFRVSPTPEYQAEIVTISS